MSFISVFISVLLIKYAAEDVDDFQD